MRTCCLFIALLLVGCGNDAADDTDAGPTADASLIDAGAVELGCDFTPPTECPSPAPTYADVEPIIQERCVTCHGGVVGNWPLDEYGHLFDWRMDIRAAMLDCAMPPRDAGMPMFAEERELILEWINCGLPQ